MIKGTQRRFPPKRTQNTFYFPENFSYNLKFYESDIFCDSSLYRIFGSENFRFPFSTKNSLTW